MDESNLTSEWNEQMAYSKIFFELSSYCRFYQSQGDYFKWKNTIQSKAQHLMGIVPIKFKKELIELKNLLTVSYNKYLDTKKYQNNPDSPKVLGQFMDICFKSEAEIDTIANKHMPFLNIKKKFDINEF